MTKVEHSTSQFFLDSCGPAPNLAKVIGLGSWTWSYQAVIDTAKVFNYYGKFF